MADMFADVVTVPEMITEAARELDMRKSVYPRWVAAKQLTQQRADRQIAVMAAILKTLEGMRG